MHDFDHYSKSAWYQINKKHDRKSGSKQYEAGYEVASDIENMFKTMAKQTHAHSPLATKRSALETMRKILKSICLHNSEVGSVVMKNIYGQMDSMIAVAKCFNADDVRTVAAEGLLDCIEELEKLAKGYCVFEELNDVLDIVSAVSRRSSLTVARGDGTRWTVVLHSNYLCNINSLVCTQSLRSSCICLLLVPTAARLLHVTELSTSDK